MANIGFSTGSLHRSGVPFDERIRKYHSFGADAIELGFATPDALFSYQLTDQSRKDITKFNTVSIHAPWKELRYGSDEGTRKVVDKLRYLCDELPITGLVLHPDRIDDFKMLDKSGLPFLLENMDIRKTSATHPEEFREFAKRYRFEFVLDVQHVYEHDHSMGLASEFIELMGNRLKHMHVSGNSSSEIHVPVFQSENREEILKVLKLGLNVPKIFEGIVLENVDDTIKKELSYVGSFERK